MAVDGLAIAIGAFIALDAGFGLVEDQLAGGFNFASLIEELSIMAIQPFVGIIPIKTDQYKMTRQVEVPESMAVTQNAQGKQFVTDSAAPRPRQWKIHGHITSLIPYLETGVVIKPTLILQKAYLDGLAESRKPCVFKTTDGEFVNVLIQSLEIDESPRFQNAFEININVKEFVYLSATSVPAGVMDYSSLGAAAAASAPTFLANVAVATAFSSVVTLGLKYITLVSPLINKDIPRTTPDSQAYRIDLESAEGASRKIFTTKCGTHTFHFDFRWNYDGERRYSRLTDLIERNRARINVFTLSEADSGADHVTQDPDAEYVTSAASRPSDFREYIEARVGFYDELLYYHDTVINAITNALNSQPVPEAPPNVIASWLSKTEAVTARFETLAWEQNNKVEISRVYAQFLQFRDSLADPPPQGLIDYLYTHTSVIPETGKILSYLRRTYFPWRNTFKALDAAERELAWKCVVSTSDLGRARTFILKQGARCFVGDVRYNISVVADTAMPNGNVGYAAYNFADKFNSDQLRYTTLVVEIL